MKKFSIIFLLVICFQLLFSTAGSALTFNPIRIELSPINWKDPWLPKDSKDGSRDNFFVSYTDCYLLIDVQSNSDFEVDIFNGSHQVVIHKAYASGVGTYSISLAGLPEGEYSIYITTKKGTLYGTFTLDSDL